MKQPDLLEDPIGKLYKKYLLPSISATLVTSVYILADTIMIGRGSGAVGIAALNILLPVFNIFFGTGVFLGVGGSVLFSVYKGRKDEASARSYFSSAILMAAIASALYFILFQTFFEPITVFLGSNDSLRAEVYDYGKTLLWGIPAFVFSSCLQAFIRNDKAPKLSMIAVISGGVLNVIIDYIFIFPMGMGIRGAALATALSSYVTVLILLLHFFSKECTLKFTKKIKFRNMKNILINGLSSFLLELTGGIVIFLFNKQLLLYIGEIGVVVYGIISNSALVVSSVSNGIGQAVQPLLAVNFGAGKRERVEQTRKLGMITTAVSGILFTGFGLLRPLWLIQAFVVPTEEIITLGMPAIRIYFLSFLATGTNMLFSTYFQSVLKPGNALILSLLRGFVINAALVMILPLYFGVNGIWSAMTMTEFLTLGIAIFMYYNNKKV